MTRTQRRRKTVRGRARGLQLLLFRRQRGELRRWALRHSAGALRVVGEEAASAAATMAADELVACMLAPKLSAQ